MSLEAGLRKLRDTPILTLAQQRALVDVVEAAEQEAGKHIWGGLGATPCACRVHEALARLERLLGEED